MTEQMTNAALQIILVANEDDAAAIRNAGYRSVRVITEPEQLYRATPGGYEIDSTLPLFDRYILAFPASHAALRDDIAVRLGDTNCSWVSWPEDAPCASQAGRELRTLIEGARPMWTDEICLMNDIPEPGPEQTFTSGFKMLDDHGFRLVRPAFMTVVGPYGSGKSVLLRQLAANLWRGHGWRTLITSFEEKVKPRFQRDLRRHLIGLPQHLWTDSAVAKADAEIQQAFRFLRRPRRDMLDQDRLLTRIEFAVKVHGVDVCIVDPINEIDHNVPPHTTKTDYLGKFIMALKRLADDFNLLMIVAVHPPKEGVEKRSARGRLLTLNDGADSSNYGNKSDVGWCVWRPGFEGPTLLHIDKLKDHETMGRPTLAELKLIPERNAFVVSRLGYDILEPPDMPHN